MVEQVFVKGFVNGEFPYSAGSGIRSRAERSPTLRKVSDAEEGFWYAYQFSVKQQLRYELWLVIIPYMSNRYKIFFPESSVSVSTSA